MDEGFVAILMGSDSDYEIMSGASEVLEQLSVPCEVKITSAHRTPDVTKAYVKDAESRGCQIFIAGAGMAAHLAGAVAAQTTRVVLGVPINSGPLQGFDALLSTVQMPAGIPVGTLAVGRAGARNAGFLAAQILALTDAGLAKRLVDERTAQAEKVAAKSKALENGRSE